ncbi:unnamed protein product [Paramecium sonneborni]|uniref:Uncharacterized protein n=1 Tax=Paramecium sonneborni TaxID=65129 RepID=A0A8S1MAM1_9CILI|nr:unnamed protein product [Paramecium sonneborni]
MDSDFSQQIVEKIDLIFVNVAKSGNKVLQNRIEEKKNQIYASIPSSSSQILQNIQNRLYINQYLNNFIQYVSKEENLHQQRFFSLIRNSNKAKYQMMFAQKFNKLPKYFKSLENQDISISGLIADQDIINSKVPVNFTVNSHLLLDREVNYIVCMTLIFNDIYDEVIFCHSLSAQKLLKKIPKLNQYEFFKVLDKYLSITINKQENIVSLQSMHPIVHFSPVIKYHENNNQQQFYLIQGMEIIISPTYKIKVIQIFYNQFEILTENYIRKTKKQQYDSKLLIQNASNYILLQPLEDKINHELCAIYDLQQSIKLDNFLKLPNGISVQLKFDGIGFLFEVLKENKNFYTSLSFTEDVHCSAKYINFFIVINNELRIQIDSEGGELFFDKIESKSNIFDK